MSEVEINDINMAIFITLARIYDLVSVIALAVDSEKASAILQEHEQGDIHSAPPALKGDAYDN